MWRAQGKGTLSSWTPCASYAQGQLCDAVYLTYGCTGFASQSRQDVADSADGNRLPLFHSLLLPNGVARPVGLEEATAWNDRAWTLREAILRRDILMLFSWTFAGAGNIPSRGSFPNALVEVVARNYTCTGLLLVPLRLHYSKPSLVVHSGDDSIHCSSQEKLVRKPQSDFFAHALAAPPM